MVILVEVSIEMKIEPGTTFLNITVSPRGTAAAIDTKMVKIIAVETEKETET